MLWRTLHAYICSCRFLTSAVVLTALHTCFFLLFHQTGWNSFHLKCWHSDSPAFLLCEATLALLFSDDFVWSLLDMAGLSLGFVWLQDWQWLIRLSFHVSLETSAGSLRSTYKVLTCRVMSSGALTPGAESVCVFLLPANCSSLAGSPVWSQWQWSLIQWFKL